MMLRCAREKESDDMIRQRDMKIEEHLETVNSRESRNALLVAYPNFLSLCVFVIYYYYHLLLL